KLNSPLEIIVKDFADYENKLRNARVMIDREERKKIILGVSKELAEQKGLVLQEDSELLEEVAGLVEWVVPLMGSIDKEFMDIPAEALTSSMKKHQKYFSVTDKEGSLAPYFMFVSNMETEDGGKAITAGNERVLRARLSDAKFFWDNDRKAKLETRVEKLKDRIFHAKLGTDYERVQRIIKLAEYVAKPVRVSLLIENSVKKNRSEEELLKIEQWQRNNKKFDQESHEGCMSYKGKFINVESCSRRAAELCKADLSTEMVGEFPDLQGTMGKYYAIEDKEEEAVSDAIEEHYSPLGPNDKCPSAPVSVSVALADKIDSLVGFWRIDMKPTGSKDPYALRRAALGVIRLIRENGLRFDLKEIFDFSDELYGNKKDISEDLFRFFVDRLKVYLKGIGMRHDLIDAVLGKQNYDISDILIRAEALKNFIESDDGSNLLIAFRRAVNIVRIEEKKDGKSYDSIPDENAFIQEEEKNLWKSIEKVSEKCKKALEQNNFEEAMLYMANLRKPVDEFFDRVTVNSDDNNLRINRLGLLTQVKKVMQGAAYFSKIEG
ncbi:MAG: glycine--tRNA ligase subunit beta, partial [Alphaproteobacteria bacterium]|nr:glycine--tRNA ligase subunit beta [Alphaproteobacteria bacterium]